jgi:hypothetical protein
MSLKPEREVAMHPSIETSSQIAASLVFGSTFVHEYHAEERQPYLQGLDDEPSTFAELLAALRSALSLRCPR